MAPYSQGNFFPELGVDRARFWTNELDQLQGADWFDILDVLLERSSRLFLRSNVYHRVLTFRIPGLRSDGSESLILGATFYRDSQPVSQGVSSAGLALALAEYLDQVRWLSRDIVVVLIDGDDPYQNTEDWYQFYLNGSISEVSFLRAGVFLDWPSMDAIFDPVIEYRMLHSVFLSFI